MSKQPFRRKLLIVLLCVILAMLTICGGTAALIVHSITDDALTINQEKNGQLLDLIQHGFMQAEINEQKIMAHVGLSAINAIPDATTDEKLEAAYQIISEYYLAEGEILFIADQDGIIAVRAMDSGFVGAMTPESLVEMMTQRIAYGNLDDSYNEIIDFIASEPDMVYYDCTPDNMPLLCWITMSEDTKLGIFVESADAQYTMYALQGVVEDNAKDTRAHLEGIIRRYGLLTLALVAALLCGAALAARSLSKTISLPVEREQQRQRDLLRSAEEEKAVLEHVNRLKTEFLANVSHELKTPLTVMSGYAQDSRETLSVIPGMADVERNVQIIGSEAERLAIMVSQILDVTHIDEGRMTMDIRPCSLVSVLQDALNIYYPVFTKNNNRLAFLPEGHIPPVFCDAQRVTQVLVNLISNAARHTHEGVITITAGLQGDVAVVCVADNGEGIAPEMAPHLFERFKSTAIKNAMNAGQSGTGLGLFICKHIVEAHGGIITVESAPGRGTGVCFTLPLAVDAPEATLRVPPSI